jgi:mono/diheme cytochrome c family protein
MRPLPRSFPDRAFPKGIVQPSRPGQLRPPLAAGILLATLAIGFVSLVACQRFEMLLADSEGQRLWIQYCQRCHGYDGAGNTPQSMGNPRADLLDDYWVHGGDRTAIEEVIRTGVFGEMPAFEDLKPDELKALVLSIRELRGERKPR